MYHLFFTGTFSAS